MLQGVNAFDRFVERPGVFVEEQGVILHRDEIGRE